MSRSTLNESQYSQNQVIRISVMVVRVARAPNRRPKIGFIHMRPYCYRDGQTPHNEQSDKEVDQDPALSTSKLQACPAAEHAAPTRSKPQAHVYTTYIVCHYGIPPKPRNLAPKPSLTSPSSAPSLHFLFPPSV